MLFQLTAAHRKAELQAVLLLYAKQYPVFRFVCSIHSTTLVGIFGMGYFTGQLQPYSRSETAHSLP
jgi:hypothetical protein